uniref:Uncharacterized protein n=1 Tax=Rhizophora mucronata TaxID=61149 RepID=A0A2P2PUR3_RHIMU
MVSIKIKHTKILPKHLF